MMPGVKPASSILTAMGLSHIRFQEFCRSSSLHMHTLHERITLIQFALKFRRVCVHRPVHTLTHTHTHTHTHTLFFFFASDPFWQSCEAYTLLLKMSPMKYLGLQ